MLVENIEDFSPCINCQTKECGLVDGNECDRCNEFFKLKKTIEQAEIVIHAHWYKDRNTKLHKCSNCHKYATYGFANARVWEQCLSKYCPFCGALMDEKEN